MTDPLHVVHTAAAATNYTATTPPPIVIGAAPLDDRPARLYGEPEPVLGELAGGPVLTAEQEIRARALDCATAVYLGAGEDSADYDALIASVLESAATFEAYIRDGSDGITHAELPDEAMP